MSRRRVVHGKIEISVGGNYNIISGKDIITTAGGSITETAGEGITYGDAGEFPPRELKAQMVVHFRPSKGWKGEYGFDWVRKGDLVHIHDKSVFGDVDYRRLITKQYVKGTQTLEMGDNVYTGDFRQDSSSYNAMRNTQHLYAIPWREMKDDMLRPVLLPSGGTQPEDYFVPWLSLFPGATAKLSLLIDVEVVATKLIFKYDEECFKISPDEIDGKPYNKQQFPHALADVISIECLKEFSQDQRIEVYANNKDLRQNLVGELRVWANDESKRKKLKVLFVEVKLDAISDEEPLGFKSLDKQEEYLKKYLAQALVEVEIQSITLDLTADEYLRVGGKGVKDGKLMETFMGKNYTKYLLDYLKGKLEAQLVDKKLEDYDVNNIIFFIAEKAVNELNEILGGFSYPAKPFQIIFNANEAANSFCTHELLHGHGLAHSFTNKEADANALYTFEALKTENIMDYSHNAGKECYSLWKWQWEILHQSKNLK